MNKKFLSAILFGALMATSAGTFVSCKDYDDDIDAINKELTDVKSQIAALQAKVDAGKWITSANSTAEGVTITLSDGSTLKITNGKDGAQGAAGQNGADGKNGTVVTVNENGVLCLDGVETAIKVAEEAPAALPCVKVEDGKLMVLDADGKYAATGIEAGAVTAAKTNGVWTITVDGQEIVVPGSAALTSIAIQGEKDLTFSYGKVAKAKAWGWSEDGNKTFDEEMEAGFYTRLSKDVDVLLNPAEADGTAFSYTFKNSKGEAADVRFFGEARPSTAILTRAASANGLWTLPAAVTKFDAADINELRNELYLNFKQNDGKPYAMTLEAVDGLGNVSTRSDYEYTITLQQAAGGASIADMKGLEIGTVYYPTIVGPVFDYKIRVSKEAANLRLAKAFGVEVTEDGKGFSAANDAAVLNSIKFDYAYVTIAGAADNSKEFTVSFTDGMVVSENLRAEALEAPFNATLANTSFYATTNPGLAPSEIVEKLKTTTSKVFVLKHKYDLSTLYAGLSEDAKMLFNESINAATAELIGGEANVGENYNAANRNGLLEENIKWSYNSTKKEIEVRFYVSNNWKQPTTLADITNWVAYSNFQLNTAYQLNLSIPDAVTGEEIVKIELPFELTQPEMDAVGVTRNLEGEFSKWTTDSFGTNGHYCNVLYLFGSYDESKMYLPLYDAFNIWSKAPYTGKNLNPNAEYYTLTCDEYFNLEGIGNDIKMSDVQYSGTWKYTTFATWNGIKIFTDAVAAQDDEDATIHDKEVWTYVNTAFDFYGVYPATKAQLGSYGDNTATTAGFRMVFASTIQKSTMEMTEGVLVANAKTNDVFVSNDNVEATTMLGEEFVLFDGLYGGAVMERAYLNKERGFNEAQRPFAAVADYEISAKYVNNDEAITSVDAKPQTGTWNEDVTNGKYVIGAVDPTAKSVQVYSMPSMPEVAKSTTYPKGLEAQTAGLVIVLGDDIEDNQPVEITIKIKDTIGFYNELKVIAKKLN